MNAPRRYAEGTVVPADKTRGELEKLLAQHGASEFALYTSKTETVVGYRIHARMVRHRVVRPDPERFQRPKNKWGEFSNSAGARVKPYSAAQLEQHAEKEWNRRWRALLLLCRAKLELVASGHSTFEREFIGDIMLPDGRTVVEAMGPLLERAYTDGSMPPLLLGPGA